MVTAVVIQLADGSGVLVRVTTQDADAPSPAVQVDTRSNSYASWVPIEVANGRNVYGSEPVYRVEIQ